MPETSFHPSAFPDHNFQDKCAPQTSDIADVWADLEQKNCHLKQKEAQLDYKECQLLFKEFVLERREVQVEFRESQAGFMASWLVLKEAELEVHPQRNAELLANEKGQLRQEGAQCKESDAQSEGRKAETQHDSAASSEQDYDKNRGITDVGNYDCDAVEERDGEDAVSDRDSHSQQGNAQIECGEPKAEEGVPIAAGPSRIASESGQEHGQRGPRSYADNTQPESKHREKRSTARYELGLFNYSKRVCFGQSRVAKSRNNIAKDRAGLSPTKSVREGSISGKKIEVWDYGVRSINQNSIEST